MNLPHDRFRRLRGLPGLLRLGLPLLVGAFCSAPAPAFFADLEMPGEEPTEPLVDTPYVAPQPAEPTASKAPSTSAADPLDLDMPEEIAEEPIDTEAEEDPATEPAEPAPAEPSSEPAAPPAAAGSVFDQVPPPPQPLPTPAAPPAGVKVNLREDADEGMRYFYLDPPDPLPAGWLREYGKVKHGLSLQLNWKQVLTERTVYEFGHPLYRERRRGDGSLAYLAVGRMRGEADEDFVRFQDGTATWYGDDDQPKAFNRFAEGRIAEVKIWHDNGQLLNHFVFAEETGQTLRGTLGMWYENGQPGIQASILGELDQDLRTFPGWPFVPPKHAIKYEGPCTFFHENGQVASRGEYLLGDREGPWEFFHEDGTRSAETTYLAGLRTGPYRDYDDQGQLIESGEYDAEERRTGPIEVHRNGRLLTRQVYVEGQPVGELETFPAEEPASESASPDAAPAP